MTWPFIAFAVLYLAAAFALLLALPWPRRAFRRWRLRRQAPELRPYDPDLRARRGRQRR